MRHTLTLALPRPGAKEPATAWQQPVQTSLGTLAVRNPGNASGTRLAIPFIALGTGTRDPGHPTSSPAPQPRRRTAAEPALH